MSHAWSGFTTGLRVVVRAGVVLCLLLAAVSLGVGVSEYPGYTRPAFRWHATEVLPLVLVGLVNLAAIDGRARWVGFLAIAIDLALFVHAIGAVQAGAPPFALMLASVAGLLVLGMVGTTLARLGA